VRLP